MASGEIELQLMFRLSYINCQQKRYIIHPQKNRVQRRNVTKPDRNNEIVTSWSLGSKEVKAESKLIHLGLLRAEKS